MDHMPRTETLTTEHIKSHLQKYRLHSNRCVRAGGRLYCRWALHVSTLMSVPLSSVGMVWHGMEWSASLHGAKRSTV